MATQNKIIVLDANKKEISLTYVQAISVARQVLSLATPEQLAKVSLATKEDVDIPLTAETFSKIEVKMALLSEKEAKHNKTTGNSASKETETQKAAREGCSYLMSSDRVNKNTIYTLDDIRSLLDDGGHSWSASQVTRRISDLYKTGCVTRYASGKINVCIGTDINKEGKTVLVERDLGTCDKKNPVSYKFSVAEG